MDLTPSASYILMYLGLSGRDLFNSGYFNSILSKFISFFFVSFVREAFSHLACSITGPD